MTPPDLWAIRARLDAARGRSFFDKNRFLRCARADMPALLTYIGELERELALRIANAEQRALTAEERLEQMTRERDEARAQLAAALEAAP